MQQFMRATFLLALVALAQGGTPTTTPMQKVMTLLTDIKQKINLEGRQEQMSYDKYACWCEEKLKEKSSDISQQKAQIEDMTAAILKEESANASHDAEIKQLNKEIAQTEDEIKEATNVRNTEGSDYEAEKKESEQCIGGLEFAIKVLTGAGAKTGFLEMKEDHIWSAAQKVRSLLHRSSVAHSVSEADLDVIKKFVVAPQEFLGSKGGASLAQSPYGDYAPQSTQIQGILKSMYDTMTRDLERSSGEESDRQKTFEELMVTKNAQLSELNRKLEEETGLEAENAKKLADDKLQRSDTQEENRETEAFFSETKQGCRTKAIEWAHRNYLRTQELKGIAKAMEIFTGKRATEVFSGSSFLQTASRQQRTLRDTVSARLHMIATKSGNTAMAKMATDVQLSGHFDDVIDQVEQMIAVCREEEQDDIKHRDRCQGQIAKNKHDLEDVEKALTEVTADIDAGETKKSELGDTIQELLQKMAKNKADQAELLKQRKEEHAEFEKSVQEDRDAVGFIDEGVEALTDFYKLKDHTEVKGSFVQEDPQYTVDPDKAPETKFGSETYGGNKGPTDMVLHLLQDIRTDLSNEIESAEKEDEEAQATYLAASQALIATFRALAESKTTAETDLAEESTKVTNLEEDKSDTENSKQEALDVKATLDKDCGWIYTHFDKRRKQRKDELDGLQEARDFLGGVAQDTDGTSLMQGRGKGIQRHA